MPIQIFCAFLFHCLCSQVERILFIFCIQVLYQICVLQVFSPNVWVIFHFLNVFCRTSFKFLLNQIYRFFFYGSCFLCLILEIFAQPKAQRFSCFSRDTLSNIVSTNCMWLLNTHNVISMTKQLNFKLYLNLINLVFKGWHAIHLLKKF